MQIITAKITTLRTLYAHVVSNSVMFPEILYDIVLYARHFLPVKFFSEYYIYKLCFELPENVTWTVLGREHSGKVSKKFIGNFYFRGITLISLIMLIWADSFQVASNSKIA